MREVPAPSWERALKRGGMMGGLMVVVFVFLLKNGPLVERIAIGVFYALAFVPLTYWVDRTAYRSYQKRLARSSSGKKR
jgi:accessory gene regulator protein AgrB